MTDDEHDCAGYIQPVVDTYDADDDEPVLSASFDGGEVIVYAECRECGREFDMYFEYSDTQPRA